MIDPLRLAIGLINTWDDYADPPELLSDPAELEEFLTSAELPELAAQVDERELRRVRALRANLRAVIEAGDETAAVAELNRMALESRAVVQLVEGERGHWQLSVRGKKPLAALCVYGLLEGIRQFGYSRFGICSGAPCRCVYVDRSRALSRRYCSQLCADRVNQARARARRRAERRG